MFIRPEGEEDFFDVGHSKNCIRPKVKKHVTEYPQLVVHYSFTSQLIKQKVEEDSFDVGLRGCYVKAKSYKSVHPRYPQ